MLAEDASLPSSPDVVLPGESLKGFFLCCHKSMCPSGPMGMSTTPVYVLPYYMEVKPGHRLRHTYSSFAGMTDQWSAGYAGCRDDGKVTVDSHCAMLDMQEVTAAVHTKGLRLFGHITHSSSCTNSITSMMIPSPRGRGRPKKCKANMKMCSLAASIH